MPLTLTANQVPPSAEMGWRLSLENRYIVTTTAGVAELADAQDLGSCGRKVVGVQIPPPAPSLLKTPLKVRRIIRFRFADGTLERPGIRVQPQSVLHFTALFRCQALL